MFGNLRPTQRKFIFYRDSQKRLADVLNAIRKPENPAIAPGNIPEFKGMGGGVGNGKSRALVAVGQLIGDAYPENRIMIGRQTYPQLRDTIRKDFLDFARKRNGGSLEPGPYVKSFKESENILTIWNNTEFLFRYCENEEAILSLNLGAYGIDQAEFVTPAIHRHLEARTRYWGPEKLAQWPQMYKKYFGVLPEYKPNNFGFNTCNPGPGWIYEEWKKNPSGLYNLFECSSEENRVNLPAGYEERLRATHSPEWCKRYLDGDWSVFAGQIWEEFSEKLHGVHSSVFKHGIPPKHWIRKISLDHGQVHPTSCSIGAIDEDGNLIIYKEYYKSSALLEVHAQGLKDVLKGDENIPKGADGKGILIHAISPDILGDYDPKSGKNFKELYESYGIYSLLANNKVNAGIQQVASFLHPNPQRKFPAWHPKGGQKGSPRLFFVTDKVPKHMHFIPLYEWDTDPEEEEKKQQYQKEKPRKYNDDACDSLRYLVMSVVEGEISAPVERHRVRTLDEEIHNFLLTGDGAGWVKG